MSRMKRRDFIMTLVKKESGLTPKTYRDFRELLQKDNV